ncbi:uncharacterized protein [Chanodichthys erythropterus]|uniref:uncharacterized protein n=1 Tax=Chanodichthys erythropterus TaxID=933992 RepID=UPI00351DB40B
MLQMLSLTAQMADQKDWLCVVRNTLLTSAAEQLRHQSQKQLDKDGREVKADDSNQRCDHNDLTEVNFFLAHILAVLKQEVNYLKLQITETHKELMHAKSHIDQLEMEARDRHKDPDRIETQKKRELRLSYLQQTEPLQEKHLTSLHGVSRRTSPSQAQRYRGGSQSLLLDTLSANFLKSSAAAEGEGLIQTDPGTRPTTGRSQGWEHPLPADTAGSPTAGSTRTTGHACIGPAGASNASKIAP